MKHIIELITLLIILPFLINAQVQDEQKLQLSGSFLTDQRFLLDEGNQWAWNENRLSLELDKSISGNSRFSSELWLRNIGLPKIVKSEDLFKKNTVDPYNLEIRQAYFEVYDFLIEGLDMTLGRQRIAWGAADQLNPTDNLNPYDLEDILDFGRHRGSDAIRLQYYLSNHFSLEGVYIPFFRPANMPIGIFSNALTPEMSLPDGLSLRELSDTLLMPGMKLGKCGVPGFKFKGFAGGIDFSLSYVYGIDGIPFNTRNTIIPVDPVGGVSIEAELGFVRQHITGIDLSTSLFGIGIWAEGALFIPSDDVVMTTDLTALYPMSPDPVTLDSILLEKHKPYLKFIIGGDYFFADGSYLNAQFMHGFIHERGSQALNDYLFLRYEKPFFNEKVKIAPLGGGFVVSDWSDIKNNYAMVFIPELSYYPTDNVELVLSAVLFKGSGNSLFAKMEDYNMMMLKFRYSF